jgi:hypothetical protein
LAVGYFIQGYQSYALEFGGNVTVTMTVVPLPAAAWVLLSGLAGVGAMARRRTTAV